MTKAPAKRGGRSAAPDAGLAPQISMTAEQLAALVQGAVASALAGVQAANVQPAAATSADDDRDDEDDYRAEKERKRVQLEADTKAAEAVVSTLIEPRFLEIFRWLAKGTGHTDALMIRALLREGLIKHKAAFRESQGELSASSRDAAALIDRLPARN